MALKVCEIRHGGRSDKYYTMSDFADDIGVNRKTLQQWVHTYRDILLKCDLGEPTPKQWADAAKVEKLLKNTRTIDNKLAGKSGTRHSYRKDIPRSTIRQLFKEVSEDKDNTLFKVNRGLNQAKHVRSIIKTIDMNKIDPKFLESMMEILDETSDMINDFLTNKRKAK